MSKVYECEELGAVNKAEDLWKKHNTHLPRVEQWPQKEVLVSQSVRPLSTNQIRELCETNEVSIETQSRIVLANSKQVRFDSELFQGSAFLYLQELDEQNSKSKRSKDIQKRRSHFVLKGRFKKRVKFSDLQIGHEFPDGIRSPPQWQQTILKRFLKRFFPHLEISFGRMPSVLAPLISECKRIRVRRTDGCDDELFSVPEETQCLGGYFAEQKRSYNERLRFFRQEGKLDHYYFDTDFEYTFEFYQRHLSLVEYKLHLGFISLNIGRILRGRPLQFLIKEKETNQYLCYFQFWSKSLIRFWENVPYCY